MTWMTVDAAVEEMAGPCNINGQECGFTKTFVIGLVGNRDIQTRGEDGVTEIVLEEAEAQAAMTRLDYHLTQSI